MSHSRRGGRWGVNFISGSGPQHSLSTHSVFNDDNTDVHGQSGDYKNTKPSNFVRAGGASVPPPPSLSSRNSKGYSDPNEILINHTAFTGTQGSGSTRAFANLGRKRVTDEDDYFLEDDDTNNLEYQPAPGSPAAVKRSNQADAHSDDSDDPLDQFMAGINAIDPLPPVDHSMINYAPFAKNFYVEHEEISSLDEAGVDSLRAKLGLRVSGPSPLRPVCSFAHLGLDEPLMEAIRKAGYTQPTPIQAQAVPLVLAGRDVIGIGKTGSGKTAAFLWPLIIHIMDQPELKLGDGPIGVICAPTRELALQIYSEAKKLAKVYNLTVVCAYGGGSLWEQQKACEAGCEILVCTPGRLIDIVKKKSTNLRRVTYLVFDEADKMFNLGFALLFSATFKRRLERLARDILLDPIRIVQGELGEANEDITQHVEIFDKIEQKWDWLTRNLVRLTTEGSVLIFVTRKVHSEEVAQKLKSRDLKVLLIHGDMHQSDPRGLDIPSIHNVINYEVARDIDTHTHRIGRTGRAGAKGTAYTLFVAGKDPVDFAACLVQHLESSSQIVPQRLLDIALKCTWFANNRSSLNNGDGCIRPSGGFEPRQPRARPGLGLSSDNNDSSYYCPRSGPAAAAAAGEGAELIRPGGLQADRFSAMKAAFSAQYNRRFVSAGVEASRYTHPEMLKSSNATAVDKLQLTNNFITQSNLEELKNHSHQPKSEQQSQVKPQNVQTDSTKQKRSRWD
ncbi:ATP-dependent RNA helicase DDX42 [Schistosoma japonicum]|nr:ATP-dependent RNA helicase DDX42 [Schistosoma japonicum]